MKINREPLTNSVSVQEMLEMRESGLSNKEIAERLDVAYSTICRYIGRNPKQAKKVNFKPEMVRKNPTLLKVIGELVTMSGKHHTYSINKYAGEVVISEVNPIELAYGKDTLELFISELLEVLSMIKGDDIEQGATQG